MLVLVFALDVVLALVLFRVSVSSDWRDLARALNNIEEHENEHERERGC